MARLKSLLECVGLALCEKARRAMTNEVRFVDIYADFARNVLEHGRRELPGDEFREGLSELLLVRSEEYTEKVDRLADGLSRVHSLPYRAELFDYVSILPAVARRYLSRPSDPSGRTLPDAISIQKPEDLYPFLPSRRPVVNPGREPQGLDGWRVHRFSGFGETADTWVGGDADEPALSPASLKFIVDPESRAAVLEQQHHFVKAFELNEVTGVVPLRSVFLETDPPCLESPYLSGYNMASLLMDWKWRYDTAKPEAAHKLIRRLTEIVAKAHKKGIVHRDLKPSNVLLHPTRGGKITVWVTDFGWGVISSMRSLALARGGTPRAGQVRLGMLGSYTPLYASPQMLKKEPADPRDDIYALGMIWYQLLKRSPSAAAPVSADWVEEFRPAGFSDSQARLLTACLSPRPDLRPADALVLAEELSNVEVALPTPAGDVSNQSGLKLQPVQVLRASMSVPASDKIGMSAVLAAGSLPLANRAVDGMPRLLSNSIGMTFTLIGSGSYRMGSNEMEGGRRGHEGPLHEIRITRHFYLGVFPVTQSEYEKVFDRNPAAFNRARGGGPEFPVEQVTFDDAGRFCASLGKLPGEASLGRKYRLPTEAEWEYACRAGTSTPFSCGDKLTPKDAHYAAAGMFSKSGGQGRTAPVGAYPPNAFGLHDMHGNVLEWVNDWYDEYYYHGSPKDDPTGPAGGTQKVVRGGCWAMFANDCRSAARRPQIPAAATNTVGFRVVLIVPLPAV